MSTCYFYIPINHQQVVVQVVIIADDNEIRDKLADHGFHVQTVAEVAPIEVQPARVLSHLYTYLGRNKKLGLTGRKSRDVGILSTSKLYSLKDRIFAFTPQVNNTSYLTGKRLILKLKKGLWLRNEPFIGHCTADNKTSWKNFPE